MQLSAVGRITKGHIQGDDVSVSGFSIDTRTLLPGQCYIAIKGENFDGHEFVAQAMERGAVAAVVARPVPGKIPQVIVADTRLALGQIGAHFRDDYQKPVIALTGSCGKTTTKEMIGSVLSQQGKTLYPQASFNNDIGVPLTLLQLKPEHEFAVFELGANAPGEIAYTAGLVRPDIALITNIGPAHIGGYGSEQAIADTKAAIYKSLSPKGCAIVNIDDKYAPQWLESLKTETVITFGLSKDAQVTAHNIQFNPEGLARFELVTPAGKVAIQLPVAGQHNVMNALAAASVAHALSIDLSRVKQGLETVMAVKGRLCVHVGKNQTRIIDDTYNANLSSVTAAISVLSNYPGNRIFVLGDLGELGDFSQKHHEAIGAECQRLNIDELYTCGKQSAHAHEYFTGKGQHFTDQATLISLLTTRLAADTTVLVKGSRSAKMEHVVQALLTD
jgi:UDP-N-acetylmuramoyl-tripeptide--D-alanyl-D-alanine ligase